MTVNVTERIDLPTEAGTLGQGFILPGLTDGAWLRGRLGDATYERGVRTGAIVEAK